MCGQLDVRRCRERSGGGGLVVLQDLWSRAQYLLRMLDQVLLRYDPWRGLWSKGYERDWGRAAVRTTGGNLGATVCKHSCRAGWLPGHTSALAGANLRLTGRAFRKCNSVCA